MNFFRGKMTAFAVAATLIISVFTAGAALGAGSRKDDGLSMPALGAYPESHRVITASGPFTQPDGEGYHTSKPGTSNTAEPGKAGTAALYQTVAGQSDTSDDVGVAQPSLFDAQANAALLVNENSGKILYEKNADETIYPASTTKVLTCLIIIEAIEKGEIDPEASFAADGAIYSDIAAGGSTAHIAPGEVMSVMDYLHCALLVSANEACNALAIYYAGSIDKFVDMMNQYADSLGCTGSHFANTHGMSDSNHYTTARDLYLIFSQAIDHDLFREICSKTSYTVPATNVSNQRDLVTSNVLIDQNSDYYYDWAVLGKTGTTSSAGSCLLCLADKDGERMVSVVMGANYYTYGGRRYSECFSQTRDLISWGYDNFGYHTLLSEGQVMTQVPVKYGRGTEYVNAIAIDKAVVYSGNYDAQENVEYNIQLCSQDPIPAPVKKGADLGTVQVLLNGEVVWEGSLAAQSMVSFSTVEFLKTYAKEHVLAIVIVIVLLICAAVAAFILIRKKRSAKVMARAAAEEQENLEKYELSQAGKTNSQEAGNDMAYDMAYARSEDDVDDIFYDGAELDGEETSKAAGKESDSENIPR